MKTTARIFISAALTCGALTAQNVVYQQAGAIGLGGVTIAGGTIGAIAAEPLGARTIAGSPFSATEQRHSLQVLGDGTRIERTDNSQLSRDSEGRTRTEMTPSGGDGPAIVTIQDPVAGANYFLDTVHKSANKMPLPKGLPSPTPLNVLSSRVLPATAQPGTLQATVINQPGPEIITSGASAPAAAPRNEDLGTQNINGVLAKGTRTTITIPVGQIGNDRELQVVSERWYSDDLQMVLKSSNSDPRFGTTTYELTNISRVEPSASLFQIPADYTVNEGKAVFTTFQSKQ
jgi:hypothetical protein